MSLSLNRKRTRRSKGISTSTWRKFSSKESRKRLRTSTAASLVTHCRWSSRLHRRWKRQLYHSLTSSLISISRRNGIMTFLLCSKFTISLQPTRKWLCQAKQCCSKTRSSSRRLSSRFVKPIKLNWNGCAQSLSKSLESTSKRRITKSARSWPCRWGMYTDSITLFESRRWYTRKKWNAWRWGWCTTRAILLS